VHPAAGKSDAHAMRVERYQDGRRFLDHAEPFLLTAEAQHGMLLGLGSRVFSEEAYLATVDDGERVVGCAACTPPFGMVLSRITVGTAIAALVADIAEKYTTLPSAFGPEPTVGAFASIWAHRSGTVVHPLMRMRLFEARQVLPPSRLPQGRPRQAAAADLPTLLSWVAAFHEEARTGHPVDPLRTTRDDVENGRLFVWDNGGLVSLAKGVRRTSRAAHIGVAFTPPEHRSRGYASALVAGLTQRLLDDGAAFCCINADTTNATTNKIYPALGYQLVAETANIEFSPLTAAAV
jgi:uncharacterized protein